MAHLGSLADAPVYSLTSTDGLHYSSIEAEYAGYGQPLLQSGWVVTGIVKDVSDTPVRRACVIISEDTLQSISVSYSLATTGVYACPAPSPSPVMRIVQDADTGNEFNHIVHARITPV